MDPCLILKVSSAHLALEKAESQVSAVEQEISDALDRRTVELHDQYSRDNLPFSDRFAIGEKLANTLSGLLEAIWDGNNNNVTDMKSRDNHQVKKVTTSLYPDFYLTRFKYMDKDRLLLTTVDDSWSLNFDGASRGKIFDRARTHAELEDDIDTVRGIFIALGLKEVPD